MVINKEFIQELQSDQGTRIIGTGDIIPKALTHSYILRNNQPYKIVYDNYCINGLLPYFMVIYGAYHRRDDLANKLRMIIEFKERIYIGDKKIKYFSDLDPYFKEYAEAFKEGFNNFEADNITPYLLQENDKQDTINKIFEYVSREELQISFAETFDNQTIKNRWLCTSKGFTVTTKNFKNKTYQFRGAREDGKAQGYLYRAWSAILANPNQFAPLFKDIRPTEPETEKIPDSNIRVKHLVMADVFERYATGKPLPATGKKAREAAGIARENKCKTTGRGMHKGDENTFYKNYDPFTRSNTDINVESDLRQYFGDDWREILLQITNEPEAVKEYLKTHKI